MPPTFAAFGRKGKNSYSMFGGKTGRKALYIVGATNTLTHVCRIGLIAGPIPNKCIPVSTCLSAKKEEAMKIFSLLDLPTITSQQNKVAVVNGRPIFYKPEKLKQAIMQVTMLRPRETS
ncbi:MAG: hypothetical protein WC383_07115 [Gammaproteobacteria bacterium]